MTAMTAATIDQLSDGRMLLGIGSSRPAGRRGLARPALRQADAAHARVRRGRAQGARARAPRVRRRDARAAAARRPGQGAEAHDRAVQERDPDLPRGDRPEQHAARRRDRRRLDPDAVLARARRASSARCSRRAPRASGRSLDGFDIAPTVNVFVTDDVAGRRATSMRPFIALYVGGMGSREKNFYNALVQRYGFEDEAREVQDLYLDGKREEAMARAARRAHRHRLARAGPKDDVRDRLAGLPRRGRRHARASRRWRSTRTSGWSSCASLAELDRRLSAAGPPRRVRRPGPRVPDDRARARRSRARGHDVTLQTWARWRERRRGARA